MRVKLVHIAGLLANLTCIQAELYQMEAALSTGEDPLWFVPYATVANDYHSLLQDYTAYVEVCSLQPLACIFVRPVYPCSPSSQWQQPDIHHCCILHALNKRCRSLDLMAFCCVRVCHQLQAQVYVASACCQ